MAHPLSMWRALTPLMILVFWAMSALAGERPKGLLWNRSGLAATLPLQVKTTAGTDYFLRLRDAETGQFALAAYIRGGEFFRVLVPPGLFELHFAFGTNWMGEEALFGSDTQHLVLDHPLSFGASVTRKHGHLIDLNDATEIAVRNFNFCQRQSLALESLLRPPAPVGKLLWHPYFPIGTPRELPPFRSGLQLRDPRFRTDRPNARLYPEDFLRPEFITPNYDLQSHVCD